jgi:hypothetical protein
LGSNARTPSATFGLLASLGVERQGAEVADAELLRPEALPAEQRQEVVLEGADVVARLPDPEGRLDDGGDAAVAMAW